MLAECETLTFALVGAWCSSSASASHDVMSYANYVYNLKAGPNI
jgi:hypothetical protein